MLGEDVTGVDFTRRPFVVRTDDTRFEAQAVVIATGASATMLGLPSETLLIGHGVSTCATCDGFFFKDRDVMVVGGGDSALEEALYLARLGRRVMVVHRRETLRASKIMQDRAFAHPKIAFLWNKEIVDILDPAAGKVTAVVLRDVVTGERTEHPVDGVFVAIGHQPNTAVFAGQVELLPSGYIRVEPGTTRTSVPGVFAAGDVQDSVFRQAVTAAGTGCMAALEAERWLEAQRLGRPHLDGLDHESRVAHLGGEHLRLTMVQLDVDRSALVFREALRARPRVDGRQQSTAVAQHAP